MAEMKQNYPGHLVTICPLAGPDQTNVIFKPRTYSSLDEVQKEEIAETMLACNSLSLAVCLSPCQTCKWKTCLPDGLKIASKLISTWLDHLLMKMKSFLPAASPGQSVLLNEPTIDRLFSLALSFRGVSALVAQPRVHELCAALKCLPSKIPLWASNLKFPLFPCPVGRFWLLQLKQPIRSARVSFSPSSSLKGLQFR